MTLPQIIRTFGWGVVAYCSCWAAWLSVTVDLRAMPQMRPALSSYGSSQQVVSPPLKYRDAPLMKVVGDESDPR